jgi:hypothetical protein
MSSAVVAGVAALSLFTAPSTVHAQGLIDFLWGGSEEWGGGRQVIKFDPKYTPGQIIVSFGDRRLYLLTKKGEAISYPIAVPREKSRWQGTTKITAKKENPSWRPTPEMLAENPKLPHWVPGGHPMNPLGVRALYLGASAYRIHGTDAPWTIGQAVSQGCIRMNNKDVLDLFPRVPVGTRVTVTWERFTTDAAVASGDSAPYEPDDQPQPVTARHVSGEQPAMPPLPRKSPADTVTASADDGLPQDFIALDDNGHPIPHKSKVKKAAAKAEPATKPLAAVKPEAVAKKPEHAKAEHARQAPKVSEPKVSEPKVSAPQPATAKTAETNPAGTNPAGTKAAGAQDESKPAHKAGDAGAPSAAVAAKAPEPAKPGNAAPKVSGPEVAATRPAAPGTNAPEANEPKIAQPQVSEPAAHEPVAATAEHTPDSAARAAESARKAAEAAQKAAEMARAAAEAAKKAAADARKATSASNAPAKPKDGKSASL